MKITVYGNLESCGKCKILHKKLEDKNIEFDFIDDRKKVLEAGRSAGILSMPISNVNGEFKTFTDMIKFLGTI